MCRRKLETRNNIFISQEGWTWSTIFKKKTREKNLRERSSNIRKKGSSELVQPNRTGIMLPFFSKVDKKATHYGKMTRVSNYRINPHSSFKPLETCRRYLHG
eukprot:TRINITY_DN20717_c0_g1_i1.p1 TRINITY_DN20717_c0_g1~~TRINITY_DN20717_c0_g1_i1.p1  ORF type:complete len:102 (+),score=9.88 TRINITY_DN20717_c0_g1_i1:56-361(+)